MEIDTSKRSPIDDGCAKKVLDIESLFVLLVLYATPVKMDTVFVCVRTTMNEGP